MKDNELFLFTHGHGHPNVLEVENFCEADPIGSWIFTEYCKYGSLINYQENHWSEFQKDETKLNIMKQVTAGLVFLHSQDKIHRDVKPGNILVTPDEETGHGILVKISDFGTSKTQDMTMTASIVGTPYFAAPEMFTGNEKTRQNYKVDIFSLGVTFLAMVQDNPRLKPTGESLHENEYIGYVMLREHGYQPVKIRASDDSFTQAVNEIVQKTVVFDPNQRLSATAILQELEAIQVGIHFNLLCMQ